MHVAPAPGNPASVAFEKFVTDGLRTTRTPDMSHALKSGVDVYGLCRYAAGVMRSAQERAEIERQLIDHPWARSRVVALVRGARVPWSLAASVLSAVRDDELTTLTEAVSADPERVLAELLDSIG